MHELIRDLWTRYPQAAVVDHRDLSPDRNHNGIIEKFERIKECPCFDVIPEMKLFMSAISSGQIPQVNC